MSEPNLILVTLDYQGGRAFCEGQKIELNKTIHFATNNYYIAHPEIELTNADALVWYGPWMEGKRSDEIAKVIVEGMRGALPFEYTAYMSNEVIPWPRHIAERYLL